MNPDADPSIWVRLDPPPPAVTEAMKRFQDACHSWGFIRVHDYTGSISLGSNENTLCNLVAEPARQMYAGIFLGVFVGLIIAIFMYLAGVMVRDAIQAWKARRVYR